MHRGLATILLFALAVTGACHRASSTLETDVKFHCRAAETALRDAKAAWDRGEDKTLNLGDIVQAVTLQAPDIGFCANVHGGNAQEAAALQDKGLRGIALIGHLQSNAARGDRVAASKTLSEIVDIIATINSAPLAH